MQNVRNITQEKDTLYKYFSVFNRFIFCDNNEKSIEQTILNLKNRKIEKSYVSDIAACNVKMVWEDDSKSRMLTQQNNCILNKGQAQSALLDESILKQPVWYKLYRRSIIENIPFEKGKYHEDVFWSFQAIGNASYVSIIDYVGYYYWQRSGSIMGEKYSLNRLDAVEGKCKRQDYFREYFPELESKGLIFL